jgi:adenylate kinase family enzyme
MLEKIIVINYYLLLMEKMGERVNLGKRIMVIGSGGEGKSTLAMKLNKITNVPLIHLDKEFWKPGWIETGREEWVAKQQQFVNNETWIIDGNYGGTLDIRLSKAETVIFLDYNKYICMYRIIKRRFQNIGITRIDMGEGCNEKLDLPFIRWVWSFQKKSRCRIVEEMGKYKEINKIILKNTKETKKFLNNCKSRKII